MPLPEHVRNALRLGQLLVVDVPPQNEGWHAWVHVRCVFEGPSFAEIHEVWMDSFRETDEAWMQNREGLRHTSKPVRHVLRRVELSAWHIYQALIDGWIDGDQLGLAMRQRPVPDEEREVESEEAAVAALEGWGAEPEALRLPPLAEHPETPPARGDGPSLSEILNFDEVEPWEPFTTASEFAALFEEARRDLKPETQVLLDRYGVTPEVRAIYRGGFDSILPLYYVYVVAQFGSTFVIFDELDGRWGLGDGGKNYFPTINQFFVGSLGEALEDLESYGPSDM